MRTRRRRGASLRPQQASHRATFDSPTRPSGGNSIRQCCKELALFRKLRNSATGSFCRTVAALRVKVVWLLDHWCWGMQECGPVTKCFTDHGVTFTGLCKLYRIVGSRTPKNEAVHIDLRFHSTYTYQNSAKPMMMMMMMIIGIILV
jgi:hypothetical protein